MNKVLFEVPRIVSEQEVKDKINYFVAKAEKASKIFKYDKSVGELLVKELRDELKEEHRNNDKVKTEKFYSEHSLFRNYKSVIHESYVKTVGSLDKGQKTRLYETSF